jgi:hypothetical protein
MQTEDDLRNTQARRFAYLKHLYDQWFKVPRGNTQSAPATAVDAALGLTRQEGDRIETYLRNRNLIELVSYGPRTLSITAFGIDYVERALASPDRPSEFFLPINILHIESVTNSQIQQGTNQSTQSGQWAGVSGEELRRLTHEIRLAFGSLELSHEHRQDVDAHVETLDAQARASKPNHAIVRQTLKSLYSIAEQTGAELIAMKLAEILGAAAL